MLKFTPLAICVLLALAGCGGSSSSDDNANTSSSNSSSSSSSSGDIQQSSVSPSNFVFGVDAENNSLPVAGTTYPSVMKQTKAFFDRFKDTADFKTMTVDLGEGTPAQVLLPTNNDRFQVGKIALSMAYILIDMKKKNDPKYAEYLAVYKRVTEEMAAAKNGTDPSKYLFMNHSIGEYYYLLALNNLKDAGMLEEVFSQTVLDTLKSRLNICDMFTPLASSNYYLVDMCGRGTGVAVNGVIDVNSMNNVSNYFAYAYAIVGLRERLGWENYQFSSTANPGMVNMSASDALLSKLIDHYRNTSTGGFSDEMDALGPTTYVSYARFDRYSPLLMAEVVQRSYEAGKEASITPEMKGYLRKSVDLVLPQLNVEGKGFNYGRSIGPYGDNAMAEILTAAARAGILSTQETNAAYAFFAKVTYRFNSFWYDGTMPNPGVNMWVKGRGTDSYRGLHRSLSENFSLAHQFIYMAGVWDKLGYGYKAPMSDAELQTWLDLTQPRHKLTWYNLPTDSAHPYNAAIVTVRDGKRVINLNLSQAPIYNHTTPYFAIPMSDNLIYGTADQSYPLLVPQITYGGKNYLPVTYYKDLAVSEANGIVTVSFKTVKFREAVKDPLASTDLDAQVTTVIEFKKGSITRTDTINSQTLTGNAVVTTDFASFAKVSDALAGTDGKSVTYSNTDATSYETTGFDACSLTDFRTVGANANAKSKTPIGQLNVNFSCNTTSFAMSPTGRSFTWKLSYKDLL